MLRKKLTAFKDHFRESQLYLNRTVAATVIVIILLGILISRLTLLQIYQYDLFKTLSFNNQIRIDPITPARGLIFDRNGVILADNVPTFSLEITPERVTNLEETLDAIAKIIPVSEGERRQFQKQLKYKRRSEGIPIRLRLSEEEVAKFSLEKYRFNGVEVVARLIRSYPLGEPLAHALGYIGPISEKDLEQIDPTLYRGAYHIGKTGLEKYYEKELRGTVGYQHVESDARGRMIRVLTRIPPVSGLNLHLSLDSKLQIKAYEALGEFKGAVVAIDPNNGGILALVSKPSFDPNLFVQGIDSITYRNWRNSPDRPLFNRAIVGAYPPGSTIKPFVALHALDAGIVTPHSGIYCHGFFQLSAGGRLYRDHTFHKLRRGHGHVDLEKSIVQSCDVYYFMLGRRLGVNTLSSVFSRFGLGQTTNIDIPAESSGNVPTPEWKKRVRKEVWYPGDTINISIGQGMLLATPVQMAHAAATIAMHGKCFTPQLVMNTSYSHQVEQPKEIEADTCVSLKNPEHWNTVINAMYKVAHVPGGTGYRAFQKARYQVAGKTGTSQVYNLKQNEKYVMQQVKSHLRDHSWFIGFSPVEDPQIAIAVLLENKQTKSGADVAKLVFDSFFDVEEPVIPSEPLPGGQAPASDPRTAVSGNPAQNNGQNSNVPKGNHPQNTAPLNNSNNVEPPNMPNQSDPNEATHKKVPAKRIQRVKPKPQKLEDETHSDAEEDLE